MSLATRSSLACSTRRVLCVKPAACATVRHAARAAAVPARLSPAFARGLTHQFQVAPAKRNQVVACAASADDESGLVDADTVELKKSAGFLKTLTFVSFWTQLALSLVAGFILFFSVSVSPQAAAADISKWSAFVGVVLGLFSTFFAHGFNSIAKKLLKDESVSRGWIVRSLLTNNTLNLIGIGAGIIGLQASVGSLVGRSLMTPNGFAYPPSGSTVASLDIFALQAVGNILLTHFISLTCTNLLLRVLNKQAVAPKAA